MARLAFCDYHNMIAILEKYEHNQDFHLIVDFVEASHIRWGTLLSGEELEEEGYHSNRICIRSKLKTVVFDSFKIVYRGMTCWVRAIKVLGWVPDFEEDGEEGYDVNDGSHEDDMYGGVSENLKDVEGESDREKVPEINFEEVPDKSIFEGNSVRKNDVHSEDPFGIYEVLNKKRDGINIDDKHEDSLKYPPGFTSNEEGDVPVEKVGNWLDENRVNDGQEDGKSEVPRKGKSILELIDDLVNVGQTMGYDMIGCIKNMEEILNHKEFLSDHRPIIMREAHYDYGPIQFKFFHYWFELDGFDKLHKESLNSRKSILKAELADLDEVIDKGEGSDAVGHQRREVVRLIQEVENVDAMERGHLTIREVLVDGFWMESPHLVKHEFFEHFKNRFEKPNKSRILLERDFVKRISLEQNDDLEREVSNEEIRRAVWDCGIDKAPGTDGFTFGFYRRYWDIIGNDVVDAVKWFFCM
nr:RNA-directed DNA polymerase, eukaryota [Tanacetum cinerariifolium]